jgi:hypothetical protein
MPLPGAGPVVEAGGAAIARAGAAGVSATGAAPKNAATPSEFMAEGAEVRRDACGSNTGAAVTPAPAKNDDTDGGAGAALRPSAAAGGAALDAAAATGAGAAASPPSLRGAITAGVSAAWCCCGAGVPPDANTESWTTTPPEAAGCHGDMSASAMAELDTEPASDVSGETTLSSRAGVAGSERRPGVPSFAVDDVAGCGGAALGAEKNDAGDGSSRADAGPSLAGFATATSLLRGATGGLSTAAARTIPNGSPRETAPPTVCRRSAPANSGGAARDPPPPIVPPKNWVTSARLAFGACTCTHITVHQISKAVFRRARQCQGASDGRRNVTRRVATPREATDAGSSTCGRVTATKRQRYVCGERRRPTHNWAGAREQHNGGWLHLHGLALGTHGCECACACLLASKNARIEIGYNIAEATCGTPRGTRFSWGVRPSARAGSAGVPAAG